MELRFTGSGHSRTQHAVVHARFRRPSGRFVLLAGGQQRTELLEHQETAGGERQSRAAAAQQRHDDLSGGYARACDM